MEILLSLTEIGFFFPLETYGNVFVYSLQSNSDYLDMCPCNGALFSVIGCDLLVVRTNFVVYTIPAAVYICKTRGVTLWIILRN